MLTAKISLFDLKEIMLGFLHAYFDISCCTLTQGGKDTNVLPEPGGDPQLTSIQPAPAPGSRPAPGALGDKMNLPPMLEENWEDEADRLYEWTQDLSYDELVATPRLATSQAQYGVTYGS